MEVLLRKVRMVDQPLPSESTESKMIMMLVMLMMVHHYTAKWNMVEPGGINTDGGAWWGLVESTPPRWDQSCWDQSKMEAKGCGSHKKSRKSYRLEPEPARTQWKALRRSWYDGSDMRWTLVGPELIGAASWCLVRAFFDMNWKFSERIMKINTFHCKWKPRARAAEIIIKKKNRFRYRLEPEPARTQWKALHTPKIENLIQMYVCHNFPQGQEK